MISVIVSVYNIKAHLENCIQSILKQTYGDFELFLIDDGSTDGSGDICDYYGERDERIRVVHKENGGLSDARNTGTKLATGDWITYIDGDDYIEREYLEELYSLACESEAQISMVQTCVRHGKYAEKEQDKKTLLNKEIQVISGKQAIEEIVRRNNKNMVRAWGKLYHKSLISKLFYPVGKVHEDEFITYRIFYEVETVVVSPKQYYNYVIREESITQRDYYEKRLDKLEALREAIDFFEEKQEEELLNSAKLRYFMTLQNSWYKVKKSRVIREKREHLLDIERKRRIFWEEEKEVLMKTANPLEKGAIRLFSINPELYGVVYKEFLT